jgi:hypothetical protein
MQAVSDRRARLLQAPRAGLAGSGPDRTGPDRIFQPGMRV